MSKKKISVGSDEELLPENLRAENVERKRVNIVLDEDIHTESVKLAERLRLDFSGFVNLMLEAALSAEEQDNMIASMYASVLRRRGYTVTKDPDQFKFGKPQKGKK